MFKIKCGLCEMSEEQQIVFHTIVPLLPSTAGRRWMGLDWEDLVLTGLVPSLLIVVLNAALVARLVAHRHQQEALEGLRRNGGGRRASGQRNNILFLVSACFLIFNIPQFAVR